MEEPMSEEKQESVVFGDRNAPLTVGNFVHWLDAYFVPHTKRDDEQTVAIAKLNIAIMGNGNVEESIQHKVNEVWDVAQLAKAYIRLVKWLWIGAIATAGALSYILTIGKALAWF
jgi:hypothetical protein